MYGDVCMSETCENMVDSESSDMLKPISWLLDKKFFVPKYQCGYRWSEKQVKDLLNDIYDFCKEGRCSEEFYCLQPLVVIKNGNKWNLIDGQQRLTTIVLFVKYFNEMWLGKKKLQVPELEYETRPESKNFIEKIEIKDSKAVSSENAENNIDFYHIAKAYETINEWVENQSSDFDNQKFQSVFLHNTKIIWYEVSEKEDEINAFIRINSGKIPLTNAELIKALFLQKKNFENPSEISIHRYEMAEDWDRIEHKLQDDSFWYFLTKDTPPAYSRIEFLFDLIYEDETGKRKSKDEPLTTYLFFHKKSESSEWDLTVQWNQIKAIFDTLCEWYEDFVRYHCVGYLIYAGKRISELYTICKNKQKNKALIELKKLMLKTLPFTLDSIDELEYGQQSSETLQKFFVLYNILYLLRNSGSSEFPFSKLKTEKWDIEHIDSQTENPLKNLKEQKEWLDYAYSDLPEELKEFKSRIESYKALQEVDIDIFDALYNDITEKIMDKKILNKNSIGNLTLLDSHTNRAYGNSLFPTKRRFIIERDKEGRFIPLCTRNVFLKYYQSGAVDLRKWTADDAEKYLKNIEEAFKDFLQGVKNE